MPVLIEDYNRLFVALRFVAAGDDGVGFLGDALVEFLTVFVVLVDGLGALVGVGHVARYEQVDGLLAALHAPGGVDTRSDLEDYVGDGDLAVRKVADADYGT